MRRRSPFKRDDDEFGGGRERRRGETQFVVDVTAVFAPACVNHMILTSKDWVKVSIRNITLPKALKCWAHQPHEHNHHEHHVDHDKFDRRPSMDKLAALLPTNYQMEYSHSAAAGFRQAPSVKKKDLTRMKPEIRDMLADAPVEKQRGLAAAAAAAAATLPAASGGSPPLPMSNNRVETTHAAAAKSPCRHKRRHGHGGSSPSRLTKLERQQRKRERRRRERKRRRKRQRERELRARRGEKKKQQQQQQQQGDVGAAVAAAVGEGEEKERKTRRETRDEKRRRRRRERRKKCRAERKRARVEENKAVKDESLWLLKSQSATADLAQSRARAARSLDDPNTLHKWLLHDDICEHRLIDTCYWPMCNHGCQPMTNPYTGKNMDLIDLLQSFGTDMGNVASALDMDIETLRSMDKQVLSKMLMQTS